MGAGREGALAGRGQIMGRLSIPDQHFEQLAMQGHNGVLWKGLLSWQKPYGRPLMDGKACALLTSPLPPYYTMCHPGRAPLKHRLGGGGELTFHFPKNTPSLGKKKSTSHYPLHPPGPGGGSDRAAEVTFRGASHFHKVVILPGGIRPHYEETPDSITCSGQRTVCLSKRTQQISLGGL